MSENDDIYICHRCGTIVDPEEIYLSGTIPVGRTPTITSTFASIGKVGEYILCRNCWRLDHERD